MSDNQALLAEAGEVAKGLSAAQRARLAIWPHDGSTFRDGPDAVARELCALGVGVMMPWKHGCQMGLPALGLAVRALIKEVPADSQGPALIEESKT